MKKRWSPARIMCAARWAGSLIVVLFIAVSTARAEGPGFDFYPPSNAEDAGTPEIMRDLAMRLIPVYEDPDHERYLVNLFALQVVAGDYSAAYVSWKALRERRKPGDLGEPLDRAAIYDLYAHARALQADERITFAEGFIRAFRELLPSLSDQDAFMVMRSLEASPRVARDGLQETLDQLRGKDRIGESEAAAIIWKYLAFDAYRNFAPLVSALVAEEDGRRYTIEEEVLIPVRGRASISAVVVRPKNVTKGLPTLLEFTIDDSKTYAKECAAHGYVGVVGYSRGKRKSSSKVVPYQYDGADARTLIEWIARQPWSDGRVGMYGEGYGGFAAWAAAKHLPPALKAIATSASSAPGIGVPMGGSIFQNSAYRWSLRVINSSPPDRSRYDDDELWQSLSREWYRSGRRYRDLGRVHGTPNPIFIRWLNHPSYDRFWQKMVPYRREFARIDIPVLTMTGYFAESEPSDLYYFTQHHRFNPHADHTLLIGPYDDDVINHGPALVQHGYPTDSAAIADLRELRYQWFDHVFKGGAPPPLLNARVNYEVMGANEWRHASSLEAMAPDALRFYLDARPSDAQPPGAQLSGAQLSGAQAPGTQRSGETHRLTQSPKPDPAFVQQTVNFVDRDDAGWTPPRDLISKTLAVHYNTVFLSDPLKEPTEFSGLFSGRLDFTVNKMDMDLHITLYELKEDGDYLRLYSPTNEFRASYARDRVHRHLLKAGERQQLTFVGERMTSRLLAAGSRLVMILGVNKRPDREINYGTGNDVSEESIADAKIPLKIRWYSDSFIDIPVHVPRQGAAP